MRRNFKMKKSEQSDIEIELRELISHTNLFLKIADIQNLEKIFTKVLLKIEKLRISRDNWRNKYEELKNSPK